MRFMVHAPHHTLFIHQGRECTTTVTELLTATTSDKTQGWLVPRGEKMLYSGTDPVSYITEYT